MVRDDAFLTRLEPGTDVLAALGRARRQRAHRLRRDDRHRSGRGGRDRGRLGGRGRHRVHRRPDRQIPGCRVVGIAGTDEKCAWVVDELGFDACINHRTDDVRGRASGPLPRARRRLLRQRRRAGARRGARAGSADARPGGALRRHLRLQRRAQAARPGQLPQLHRRRARMEGFIAFDYWGRLGEITGEIVRAPRRRPTGPPRTRVDGLDRRPKPSTCSSPAATPASSSSRSRRLPVWKGEPCPTT